MGILEKIGLKKKSDAPARPAPPKTSQKSERVEAPGKAEIANEPQPEAVRVVQGNTGQAYQILVRPILSEKGTHLAGKGKYVFAVHPQSNKSEVRKSIQAVYNVHVENVHIVKMPGKMRRYGRTTGRTANWKKAIITVRKGEKIPGIIESVG